MDYATLKTLKVKYSETYALYVKDLGKNADYGFSQWAISHTEEGNAIRSNFVKKMYGTK